MARLSRKQKQDMVNETTKVNAEAMKDLGLSAPRVASMIAHAFGGANATFNPEKPRRSIFLGVVNGLLLDALAHSPFGNSLPGAGAMVGGYTAMALGSADGSTMVDWAIEEYELRKRLAYIESLPSGDGYDSIGPGQERNYYPPKPKDNIPPPPGPFVEPPYVRPGVVIPIPPVSPPQPPPYEAPPLPVHKLKPRTPRPPPIKWR